MRFPFRRAIATLSLAFICCQPLLAQANLPRAVVLDAPPLRLPGGRFPEAGILDSFDCNSPLHWDGAGNLFLFASVQHPFRSQATSLLELTERHELPLSTEIHSEFGLTGGMWLEATYRDEDGILYGWYHNEVSAGCANEFLTVPQIGALVSYDEGATWEDLGIVMRAPETGRNCDTENYFFAGGNGDFSVLLDPNKEYFYFFYDAYDRDIEGQGICLARMAYADRNTPINAVWKWREGAWNEPGLDGYGAPFLPVSSDWHSDTPEAYWGPSVHYNSYLEQYVMLLNHTADSRWVQEGIYVCFNPNLADPQGWSAPQRLQFDPEGRAYPQVVGTEFGETDKLAGRTPRLFVQGDSLWWLDFKRPGEVDFPIPPREPGDTRDRPTRFNTFNGSVAATPLPARGRRARR